MQKAMNRPILVLILLLMAVSGRAQYTAQGRIEFERKTNMHRQMEDYSDGENEWVERYKSQMPKFSVSYFNLSFNTQKIYVPCRARKRKCYQRLWRIPGVRKYGTDRFYSP